METEIEVRAQAAPWNRGVELVAMTGDAVGKIVMEKADPGMIVRPIVELSIKAAQTLMDDLWRAGLRPTEGAGSAGSLKATQDHLRDLRKIVSKTLKVEL